MPHRGFNFDNFRRNAHLSTKGYPVPNARKTGTTIVGITFRDGIILGADTRATEDTIVADKNCAKIHYMAPNIRCCGAGTAADTEMVTRMIASQLELHRLNSNGVPVRVACAERLLSDHLFKYQGHVGAALIVGGVDRTGNYLCMIYPHGSVDYLPFVTMGSGSLAAMAVFESRWRKDMELEDGKKLVRDAIAAGIFNDLGSGSNVDLCVITKEGVKDLRPYDVANEKGVRQGVYRYAKGTTATLATKVIPLEVFEELVTSSEQPMEVA